MPLGVATIAVTTMLAVLFARPPGNESEDRALPSAEGPGEVRVILTARDTKDRLTLKQPVKLAAAKGERAASRVVIDPGKTYQKILGFGGAFTEAGAYTLSRMSPAKRAEAMRAYFHPREGLGYTLCRTHINSCDFSLGNYAYNEVPLISPLISESKASTYRLHIDSEDAHFEI